ncbi:MAG TPA: lycopene cyclase family protein, partial [Parafilimonas sp.]|nr:lycopene cyclase family protein [Parafilimonas sp.]
MSRNETSHKNKVIIIQEVSPSSKNDDSKRIKYLCKTLMVNKYDYIITGAGCAGLSLLRSMMQHQYFNNKKILLIDKAEKNVNERTWCFWEQQPGLFEDIIYHRWPQIDFFSNDFSARFDLMPYQYKMIRGIDLYETVLNEAAQHENIDIIYEEVKSIFSNESYAVVKTTDKEFHAEYVFNSIFFTDWKQQALQQKNVYVLLQHFKGWMIEVDENIFDERIATFMDFRISQNEGTAFVYVLPVAKNKALIEYTVFSEEILKQKEYDAALENYITSTLNIKKYKILNAEFGVIPMTNYKFSKGDSRIINIGVVGGDTKASSGYTFQFIQKHTTKVIDALLHEKNPLLTKPFFEKRFNLYDSILLNILKHKKMNGDEIFAQLFKNNSVQTIFKF